MKLKDVYIYLCKYVHGIPLGNVSLPVPLDGSRCGLCLEKKTVSSSLRCRQAALEGGQHAGCKALKRPSVPFCYR